MKGIILLLCIQLGITQVVEEPNQSSQALSGSGRDVKGPAANQKSRRIIGINYVLLNVDVSKFDINVTCDKFQAPKSCPCEGQPERLICGSTGEQYLSYCEFVCHWKCNKQLLRIDGNCSVPRPRLNFKRKATEPMQSSPLGRSFVALDSDEDGDDEYDHFGDPEPQGRSFGAMARAMVLPMGK